MMARIGMALYWTANVLAAFLVVGTLVMVFMGIFGLNGYDSETAILESFVFIPALLIWLIGRACRYFLAGT
jgi:hypothetical protein